MVGSVAAVGWSVGVALWWAQASAEPAKPAEPTQVPAWLVDRFELRQLRVEPGAMAAEIALLGDGVVDLSIAAGVQDAGRLTLVAQGTVIDLPRSPASAFERIGRLGASDLAALCFGEGPDGLPVPVRRKAALKSGADLVVRTLRIGSGGGGALALVHASWVVEADHAPVSKFPVLIELAVLALDPAKSMIPRLADALYAQDVGRREGVVQLFSMERFGHPAWCEFDVVRLDRDHPEWRGSSDATDETLLCTVDGVIVARGAQGRIDRVGEAPGGERITRSVMGFERQLLVSLAKSGGEPASDRMPTELRWRDVKADNLEPPIAVAHPVVVTDPIGEPVLGAWVIARRANDAIAASLFAVQSDADGKVLLPVANGVAPDGVEVIAFEAGPRARFGRRTGATVAPGSGGECVVLLDQRATTTVKITPPPTFRTLACLRFAGGAFLVAIAADGTLVLPALGEPCELELGTPWQPQTEVFHLTARIAPFQAHLLPPR